MILLAFGTQFLVLDRIKTGNLKKYVKLQCVSVHNRKNHFSSFCIHISAGNIYKHCFVGISLELVILNENVHMGIY